MKLACILALTLLAGTLSAQASIPITGSISGVDQRSTLVTVNFGPTAQSVQLDLTIQATSGTSGLFAALFDLDEIAANGTAVSPVTDFDAGTGTIVLNLTTATYSGIVEFLVGVSTDSGTGTSPYSGTLSCGTLAAGSITAGASQISQPPINSVVFLHDRMQSGNRDTATQVAYEFNVNYGATAHPITYYLQGSGTAGGSITVSELDSMGNPVTNLTVSDTVGFLLENNGNTTSRSGVVRFRVTITPSAVGTFDWGLCFPSSVSISVIGGGGGGGDGGGDEESCSTGESSSLLWLLALAACAAIPRLLNREGPPTAAKN